MRPIATVAVAWLTLTSSLPAGDVFPPNARVETLWNEGCILTEGVAVAFDGMVYFSDITFTHKCKDASGALEAGHIVRYDPTTGEASIFRSPSGMSNGIKFDAEGNMVVAEGADFGGRRVTRTNMKTGKSVILAGLYEGRAFNAPNDITIDEKGRIYFSDPKYLGHEPIEQPLPSVYRIDTDGSIHRVVKDAGKPNGLAISPDQKTLYVGSNDNGSFDMIREAEDLRAGNIAILAYDLAPDGSAKFRKVLVDGFEKGGGPDGFVVDVDGNIYAAIRDPGRPGIYVYSPDGQELDYIRTEIPTNVGFGRDNSGKTLYITAMTGLYRVRTQKTGYHLPFRR
jgi:gluconolactonase